MRLIAALIAVGLIVTGCTTDSTPPPQPERTSLGPEDPMPLRGAEVSKPTDIQLVDGMRLVDPDTGRWRAIAGIPASEALWTTAFQVGRHTVVSIGCDECTSPPRVYVLSPDNAQASFLGTAEEAAPAADGVWLKHQHGADQCTLGKVTLEGDQLVAPQRIDCGLHPREETALGLLARSDNRQDSIRDPHNLRRTVADAWDIHAVVGTTMVTSSAHEFVLIDGDHRTAIPTPAVVGTASDGGLSPDGRYLEISFEHPAWPGPRQRLDAWVLDLQTQRWIHAPSMPVAAGLKTTTELWSADGRLLIVGWLGEGDNARDTVASWRPGDDELALHRVSLPDKQYGVIAR